MSLRFISDLHLDEKRPEICRAFFHYLDHLPADTEALYILGDFFEVWIGDDDDSPFHQSICNKLKSRTAAGLPIFFMHGNRDFLVGKYFELRTGCILIPDPLVIEYQQHTYLLMHGDTLCTEDTAYKTFREYIRNPETQAQLLKKTLQERRVIAQQLRETSQTESSNKSADIMDVTPSEVERIMQNYDVKTLIHGHTHRPAIHSLLIDNQPAERIVLGDWHTQGWELVLEHDARKLTSFPIDS